MRTDASTPVPCAVQSRHRNSPFGANIEGGLAKHSQAGVDFGTKNAPFSQKCRFWYQNRGCLNATHPKVLQTVPILRGAPIAKKIAPSCSPPKTMSNGKRTVFPNSSSSRGKSRAKVFAEASILVPKTHLFRKKCRFWYQNGRFCIVRITFGTFWDASTPSFVFVSPSNIKIAAIDSIRSEFALLFRVHDFTPCECSSEPKTSRSVYTKQWTSFG